MIKRRGSSSSSLGRQLLLLFGASFIFFHYGMWQADAAPQQQAGDHESPPLRPLRAEELQKEVLESDDIWFVFVTASGEHCPHCVTIQNVLEKTARNTQDIVNFGIMSFNEAIENSEGDTVRIVDLFEVFNATEQQMILPGVLIYGYGPKKLESPIEIPAGMLIQLAEHGAKLTWQQLKAFLPTLSRTVDERRLGDFLNERPTDPHVLLFTKSPLGSSALYKKLSLDFDRRAVFGEASHHMNKLAKAFGVTDYPMLLVSPPGFQPEPPKGLADKKEEADSIPLTYQWKRYSGGMNYKELAAFIGKSLPRFRAPVIRSNGDFDKYCEDKGGVCLIGVTSSRLGDTNQDPEGSSFNKAADRAYVQIDMDSAARGGTINVEKMPINFVLLEGAAQSDFLDTFDIPTTPAVVAINPRKKRYSVMKGAFNPGEIRYFVLELLDGKVPQHELPRMPRFTTTAPLQSTGSSKSTSGGESGQEQQQQQDEGPPKTGPRKISSTKKKKKKKPTNRPQKKEL